MKISIIILSIISFSLVSCSNSLSDLFNLKDQFRVSFDTQGGSSLPVQFVDPNGNISPADPVKTGYAFGGWYTGLTFTMPWNYTNPVMSDMTLFAKWDTYNYTINFDSQAATANANPASKTVASPAATVDALPAEPQKTGYYFAGWWTGTGGTGTQFTAATVVSGSYTVYANWTTLPSYTVTFAKNDGTGVTVIQNITYNTSANLLPNTFTREGYDFAGWNTSAGGTGKSYTDGENYLMGPANIILYAVWTIIPASTYKVTYDPNGGNGNVPVDTTDYLSEDTVNVLYTPEGFSREGYVFLGWNTKQDGSGNEYGETATFYMGTSDVILYAMWRTPNPPSINIDTWINDYTTATIYTYVSDPDGTLTGRGVCWSKTEDPNPDRIGPDCQCTSDIAVTGSFSDQLTGLEAGSTYYIKAYATSNNATSYSIENYLTTNAYLVGQTGPAGGIIFYDNGSYVDDPFIPGSKWRYMEAAPVDSGQFAWNSTQYTDTGNHGLNIGRGLYNTQNIAKLSGNDAAQMSISYSFGGYTDWYLPSIQEMQAMGPVVGVTSGSYYWTSSEADLSYAYFMLYDGQSYLSGTHVKSSIHYVWPARRF